MAKIILCLFVLAHTVFALRAKRESYQTDHFIISVEAQKKELLDSVAILFENSHQVLTTFFNYKPKGRIKVLLMDQDDIGNGSAFAAQGWVVISLVPAEFGLRGQARWLPNVISHELAHIITLKKMGLTSKWLGISLSSNWYHRTSFTIQQKHEMYIPHKDIPPWLAEGLAQYAADIASHDTTDSHRSMIHRTAIMTDNLLTLKEMSAFSGNSRHNEMVYNQGYFFVKLLYQLYGQEKMNTFLVNCQKHFYKKAFLKTFGREITDIFNNWVNSLKSADLSAEGTSPHPTGAPITTNNSPWTITTSPIQWNEKTLFFLSSHENDFGILSLYCKKGENIWKIHHGVGPTLKMNPAKTRLLYSRLDKSFADGALVYDLWEYHIAIEHKKKLTHKQRVSSFAYNADGNILCVQRKAGVSKVSKIDDGFLIPLTPQPTNTEILDINTGPDAQTLLVTHSAGLHSDVSILNLTDGKMSPVLQSQYNEMNPIIHQNELYYAADYNGIYNIYSKNLIDSTEFQHTSVATGAFRPFIHHQTLTFSQYGEKGFNLATLPIQSPTQISTPNVSPPEKGDVRKPHNWTFPKRYRSSQDGLSFLGFSNSLEVTGYPKQKVSLPVYFSNGEVDTTEPGFLDPYQEATVGGDFIFLHPGFESLLFFHLAVSQLLVYEEKQLPYLARGLAMYQNQFNSFTLNLSLALENKQFPNIYSPFSDNSGRVDTISLKTSLLAANVMLEIPFSRYLTSFSSADLAALIMSHDTNGVYTGAGGIFFSETMSFQIINPGVDFINSGTALSGTGVYLPFADISLGAVNFDGFMNLSRRVFFHGGANFTAPLGGGLGSSAATQAQLYTFFPINLQAQIGSQNSRHLLFTKIIPYFGFQANNYQTQSEGPYFPSQPPISAEDLTQKNLQQKGITAQSVSSRELELTKEDLNVGFLLKINSLFSVSTYWSFSLYFDLQQSNKPTAISLKISL